MGPEGDKAVTIACHGREGIQLIPIILCFAAYKYIYSIIIATISDSKYHSQIPCPTSFPSTNEEKAML